MPERIPFPVSLRPRSVESSERSPTSWVVRGPVDQSLRHLSQLKQHEVDSVDVARAHDPQFGEALVLRAKPGARAMPYGLPELVPNAHELVQHPSVGQVHLPSNKLVSPNMRGDALRRTFGIDEDPNRLSFLVPDAQDQRKFQAIRVDRNDFRPLSDVIQYHAPESSTREYYRPFRWLSTFEPFVTEDDLQLNPQSQAKPAEMPTSPAVAPAAQAPKVGRAATAIAPPGLSQGVKLPAVTKLPATGKRISDAEQQQLLAMKKQVESSLHFGPDGSVNLESSDPRYADAWARLGQIESRLGNRSGASSAYERSVWVSPDARTARAWATSQGVRDPLKTISNALVLPNPSTADANRVAVATAALSLTGRLGELPPRLLQPLGHFLDQHEPVLPVRTAWLAQSGLRRGDVVGLARVHDRLTSRHLEQVDLPDFVKAHDLSTLDAVKRHTDALLARDAATLGKSAESTKAYSDLIYAIGMAKQGRVAEAEKLANLAVGQLPDDPVHRTLATEFLDRLGQESGQVRGQLPVSPKIPDTMREYSAQKMRDKVRMLNPLDKSDTYRKFNTGTKEVRNDEELFKQAQAGQLQRPTVQASLAETGARPENATRARSQGETANALVLAAGHLGDRPLMSQALTAYASSLREATPEVAATSLAYALPGLAAPLRRNGMREDGQQFVNDLANVLYRGRPPHEVLAGLRDDAAKFQFTQASTALAAAAMGLGETRLGQSIVQSIEQSVAQHVKAPTVQNVPAIAAHVEAILADPNRQAARERTGAFIDAVKGIPNNLGSKEYFGLSHLEFVDKLVDALVNRAEKGSAWADQDEYDVKKRIRGDLMRELRQSGAMEGPSAESSRPSGRVGPYGWRLRRRPTHA